MKYPNRRVRKPKANCLEVPRSDSNLLIHAFSQRQWTIDISKSNGRDGLSFKERERSLLDELRHRGYDISTLKFSIKRLENEN
jgi:hypothetical protein